MKKITVYLLCLMLCTALLSACSLKRIGDVNTTETEAATTEEQSTERKTETEAPTETVADTKKNEEIPLPVGIYDMTYCDFGTREEYTLVPDFQDDGGLGRDICVMAVFPSDKPKLEGQYFRYIWDKAVEENPEVRGKKIGYFLEFSTPVRNYKKTILRPSDITDEYWDYLEMYIYDDVNQEVTAWHSHLLDNEITPETFVTSFKLTAGEKIGDVSDIRLTAFLYSSEKDFDSLGNYTGISKFTSNIEWLKSRAK